MKIYIIVTFRMRKPIYTINGIIGYPAPIKAYHWETDQMWERGQSEQYLHLFTTTLKSAH